MSESESFANGVRPENDKQVYYDDLERVGKVKPLGYLPLDTIRVYNREDPEVVAKRAKESGLYAILFSEEESRVRSGALYIADIASLNELLLANRTTLLEYGWPADPLNFIRRVTTESAPKKTVLFDLIADAFADYTNPGRTDVADDRKNVRTAARIKN